ncbi:hypothetical protein PIB30_036223 [Stylosanthes scabra]|uniref:Uncharacterized protein n=1 Tax=Stylosanthes scabra TaxID=79078 RepID=A0ABU6UEQ6_9FABA|nr:hypothetical protein [Stylosanthes scabra]
MNPPLSSYDETLRTYQQESRELREAHKRTEDRLNDLTELLYKFASQMAVNSQPPSEIGSDSENEYEDDEEEEVTEEDEDEEMTEIIKEATEEVGSPDKEEEFFIATVGGGNEENPEDLPEKCADPGPCFVTCKVGKIYVPDCLCDPGACASVIPLELYKVLDLGSLKKTTDTFYLADTKPPEVTTGPTPQVLLGRPFPKTAGFKLNFYDETFSLEVGNVIEIFQATRPPISQEESEEEPVVTTEPEKTAKRAVPPKLKMDKKNPIPTRRRKQKKEDTKAVKKKPEKEREERKAELNCTDFKDLLGKLKKSKSAIIKDGDIGDHLVEDNSKWK